MPLACAISATVRWNFFAISESRSPFWMMYSDGIVVVVVSATVLVVEVGAVVLVPEPTVVEVTPTVLAQLHLRMHPPSATRGTKRKIVSQRRMRVPPRSTRPGG